MINIITRSLLLCGVAFASHLVAAVEITATDVSNTVITCNSPLLKGKPAGACLVNPPDTLQVVAKLEDGDDQNDLNKVYVTLRHNGKFYQYINDPGKAAADRWQLGYSDLQFSFATPTVSSFEPTAFERGSVARNISIAGISKLKGAEVFVGTRSDDSAKFKENNVKKVFEVK